MFLLVTRQKKFIEDDCLKPLTITWLCIFASYHAIFPTMQASIAFIVYQQKANIFNFLQMAAKYGSTSSLPYRTNPKKAEPRSLCRLFPPHFQKLPTLVMNVMRMPNTPEWLHRFWLLNFTEFLSSIRHLKCFIIPTSILTTSCCGC